MHLWLIATLGIAHSSGVSTEAAPGPQLPYAYTLEPPADVARAPEEATVTESGLAYIVVRRGASRDQPSAKARVTTHYTGWTSDGERFDSSRERGEPNTFGLNQVIPGWTEGVQLMSPGDVFRFWIPEDLAYGGRPGRPQGVLVYEVELIEFDEPAEPPATPDTLEPPEGAQTTKSGLTYVFLERGEGGDHPSPDSRVWVHYAGWTLEGKLFDWSRKRSAEPKALPLNGVIEGWTEGVQLMSVGDRARFWIPEDLAYKGRPGPPAGLLIFDIELHAFE